MTGDALVSCLMVTKPTSDRFPYVKQSIAAYTKQSHSKKELVLVHDGSETEWDDALVRHVGSLGRSDVRIVPAPGQLTLGALRNLSITAAKGDILCQWDDDDMHHPERIERQLATMIETGRRACYLQDVMQFDVSARTLYWTNWRMAPGHVHPGTVLFNRTAEVRYPETGSSAALAEDSAVLADLQGREYACVLADCPYLYIYVTHGWNLCPPTHHRMLMERLSLSSGLLRRREQQIRKGLSAFDFGFDDVVMTGSNGPAFSLSSPETAA